MIPDHIMAVLNGDCAFYLGSRNDELQVFMSLLHNAAEAHRRRGRDSHHYHS